MVLVFMFVCLFYSHTRLEYKNLLRVTSDKKLVCLQDNIWFILWCSTQTLQRHSFEGGSVYDSLYPHNFQYRHNERQTI